jgi:hypothetical protein
MMRRAVSKIKMKPNENKNTHKCNGVPSAVYQPLISWKPRSS